MTEVLHRSDRKTEIAGIAAFTYLTRWLVHYDIYLLWQEYLLSSYVGCSFHRYRNKFAVRTIIQLLRTAVPPGAIGYFDPAALFHLALKLRLNTIPFLAVLRRSHRGSSPR